MFCSLAKIYLVGEKCTIPTLKSFRNRWYRAIEMYFTTWLQGFFLHLSLCVFSILNGACGGFYSSLVSTHFTVQSLKIVYYTTFEVNTHSSVCYFHADLVYFFVFASAEINPLEKRQTGFFFSPLNGFKVTSGHWWVFVHTHTSSGGILILFPHHPCSRCAGCHLIKIDGRFFRRKCSFLTFFVCFDFHKELWCLHVIKTFLSSR